MIKYIENRNNILIFNFNFNYNYIIHFLKNWKFILYKIDSYNLLTNNSIGYN